jgi:hypothetical protein
VVADERHYIRQEGKKVYEAQWLGWSTSTLQLWMFLLTHKDKGAIRGRRQVTDIDERSVWCAVERVRVRVRVRVRAVMFFYVSLTLAGGVRHHVAQ